MKKRNALSGKKQLSWWLVLLALLSLLPVALTETGTVFPWRDYTLDVTLATSDPALVNADAPPVKGTFVLVEVTTLAQDMATTDIEQYCGDFSLRDGDGAEYTLYSWRVRGVTIVDGEFGIAPQQKVLELIFLMEGKEATAFEDAKLLIATEREGERVVVSLSKAPSVRADSTTESAEITPAGENERSETTEAPTVAPRAANQPTATPEPADDVIHSSLETLLAQCQETAQTPWQAAIYEVGAKDVRVDGTTVTFFLRSFNPQPKLLGKNGGDVLAILTENASAFDLQATLTLQDGNFTGKSIAALQTTVSKAAAASAKAFADKRVRAAIVEWLFPKPADNIKTAEDLLQPSAAFTAWIEENLLDAYGGSEKTWAPLFFGQTKQTLAMDNGPHALLLRCVSISPEELLNTASQEALAWLAKQEIALREDDSAIESALLDRIAVNAIAMRKKAKEEFTLTLDVDELAQRAHTSDYVEYLERYQYNYTLTSLLGAVSALPEERALDFPDSGRISGNEKGTKIIVKAPKDGLGRYFQLRDYDSDTVALTAFIRPGTSCTVRTPQGNYYFLIASGTTWYGEETLFGDNGSYSRTDLFEVASSRYYHIVTLETVEGGNMSVYGENAGAFAQ